MGLLFKEKNEKVKRFAHILAGCIILVHAYEKYDDHQSSYVVFLGLGIVFLLIALQHHRLAKRYHFVDSVFLVIEAVGYGFIATDYFNAGKKALPWCYVFAAIAYVVVALVRYRQSGSMAHGTTDRET